MLTRASARANVRHYRPGAAATVRHRCGRSSPHRRFLPCSPAPRWSAATPPSIRCCALWRKHARPKIPAISFTRCRMVNSAGTCRSTIQLPNWQRVRSALARTVSSEMPCATVSTPPEALIGEVIIRRTATLHGLPRAAVFHHRSYFRHLPPAGMATPAGQFANLPLSHRRRGPVPLRLASQDRVSSTGGHAYANCSLYWRDAIARWRPILSCGPRRGSSG
jgi:hypothetical protein